MPAASTTPPLPPPPTVAITGAGGALGRALLRRWHARGARLIALSHSEQPIVLHDAAGQPIPLQQRRWQVGAEEELRSCLEEVDVLVLNHGINLYGARTAEAVERSLQVNALSAWKVLELFAAIVAARAPGDPGRPRAEVWVNTSEAEIQPAISPLYEISKRLLGQLLSLRALELGRSLRLRRLVLGPFRSELNPIGLMDADWVAGEILRQADWNCSLIVVTINPLTYVLMPLTTLLRWAYFQACSRADAGGAIRSPGR
jgi:NAD(P)-dependent dehydrogenase (short-subunit alcohol dehydrogenase family)